MLVGVNVHDEITSDTTSPYSNATAVQAALLDLKPKIVRGISPTNTQGMQWLASQGIGYIIAPRQGPDQTTVALYMPGVQIAHAARVPVAIEGLNEPDIAKPHDATYTDWVGYTKASQAALWLIGQSLGVTVLGPSVVFADGATALGPVPMDKLNVHCYGWPHTAVPDIAAEIKQVRALAPDAGVWVTECGASTYFNYWPFRVPDITEQQQSDLIMAALANARTLGVEAFVIYELVDQHHSSWSDLFAAWNREENFGVFRSDWTEKPIVSSLRQAAT